MKHGIFRFFLIGFLLLAALAAGTFALADTSGVINDRLSWSLTEDGVLTLTGEGSMPDMYYGIDYSLRWESDQVREAVIGEGITSLGPFTFERHQNLEKVTFASTVTSIGEMAFLECTGLKQITIPGNVDYIDEYVFKGCDNLESAVLQEGVRELGHCVFIDCEALSSVQLPESLREMGQSVFHDCGNLHEIQLPSGLTRMDDGAFAGSGLRTVTIPKGMASVPRSMFYGCAELTSVTLHSGINEIGINAFTNCTALTEVKLFDGLICISDGAFQGCKALKELELPESVQMLSFLSGDTFSGCESLRRIVIPEGVTSLGDGLFEGCTSLQDITIPDSVTEIYESTFENCNPALVIHCYAGSTADLFATWKGLSAAYLQESDRPTPTKAPAAMTTPAPDLSKVSSEPINLMTGNEVIEATSPDNPWVQFTSEDGNYLFERKGFIKSGGQYASYLITLSGYRGNETRLILPPVLNGDTGALSPSISVNYIKTLGKNDTVKTIVYETARGNYGGEYAGAFSDLSALESFETNENTMWTEVVEDGVLYEKNYNRQEILCFPPAKKGECNMPAWVSGIADYAFRNAAELTSVQLPVRLKSIGRRAFENTPKLGAIFLPDYIESIYYNSFSGCGATIYANPYTLTAIALSKEYISFQTADAPGMSFIHPIEDGQPTGLQAEGTRKDMTSVNVPDGVTILSRYSFSESEKLKKATLPEGLTTIGEMVFYNCPNLTSVDIPDSVTEIRWGAFYYDEQLILTVGKGTAGFAYARDNGIPYRFRGETEVHTPPTGSLVFTGISEIGESAYEGDEAFATAYVPDSCKTIGAKAFKDCIGMGQIRLPKDCEIHKTAFSGCVAFTIVAPAGGTTEAWAERNGIPFLEEE